MNDIILNILEIAIVITVALITRYLIPWIKSHIAINENEVLIDLVNMAVMYAEQTMTGGKVKKDAVIELLKKELAERGINVTDEQINALIEASVYAMNLAAK